MTKRTKKESAFRSSYNYEVSNVLIDNNLIHLVSQSEASTTGLSPANFCLLQGGNVFNCLHLPLRIARIAQDLQEIPWKGTMSTLWTLCNHSRKLRYLG